MDLRLIPMLALLYLLSFLDRSNIGNAKIQGMQTDLNLTGPEYNLCATVFVSHSDLFPFAREWQPLTSVSSSSLTAFSRFHQICFSSASGRQCGYLASWWRGVQ
jgi:hypothetical protein